MIDLYVKRAAMREAELKYLAEMLPQLQQMAENLEEDVLSKLLEMAALEASLKVTLEEEYANGDDRSLTYDDMESRVA